MVTQNYLRMFTSSSVCSLRSPPSPKMFLAMVTQNYLSMPTYSSVVLCGPSPKKPPLLKTMVTSTQTSWPLKR